MSSSEPASMCCAPASRCSTWCSACAHFPRPDVKTQATAFRTVNGGNGGERRGRDRASRRARELRGPARRPARRRHGRRHVPRAGGEREASIARRVRASPASPTSISAIMHRRCTASARSRTIRDERLSQAQTRTTPTALVGGCRRSARRQPLSRISCARSATRRASAAFRSCSTPTSRVRTATMLLSIAIACGVLGRRPARDRRHRQSRPRADRCRQAARSAFLAVTRRRATMCCGSTTASCGNPGVHGRRGRHARRRRHVPRRLRAGAGRGREMIARGMRFSAAAAALKCTTRSAASSARRARAEVEAFLAKQD